MKRLLLASVLLASVAHADVTGTAVTIDGTPVAGARVQLFEAIPAKEQLERILSGKEEEPRASAVSDSRGNFKLEMAKAGNFVITATADGFAPLSLPTTGSEDLGGLLMRAAALKTGRVTAGGKPVADAYVVFSNGVTQFAKRTDGEGRYSIADPAAWSPYLRVVHPQYATFIDAVGGPGNPPVKLDVHLSTGITLRGRVVAADGKTGTKARIDVDGTFAGESADDGQFTIEHAPAAWKEVAARSGDRVAIATRGAIATIRLARAVTLTGSVLDAKSRAALAGAIVTLEVTPGDPVAEVRSNAKGAFTIPSLLPGTFRLNVRHAGYGISTRTQSIAGATSSPTIYLRRDAVIRGRISDGDGRPVTGARVTALPRGRRGMSAPPDARVSAVDGRYARRIGPENLEPGDLEVRAEKNGFALTKDAPHTLAPGDEKVVNLTMDHGVALSGRVVDTKGEPIGGVAIYAAEADPRMFTQFQGDWSTLPQTGNDGAFALRLRPSNYNVTFVRAGFGPRTIRDVKAAAASDPLEVKLEPSVSISGRVVTSAGDPVDGALVEAWVPGPMIAVVTSESGAFVIDGLPAEKVQVSVSKESLNATEEREIKAPASDVKIELAPSIKLAGRVLAKGGSAVTDFTLAVVGRQDGGFFYGGPTTPKPFHDSDGAFVIEQLPVRPSDLLVKAPGYGTARVALPLEKGKDIENFEITLERAGTLRGRVTSENGTPIDRASVRIASEAQREQNSEPVVTDPNGDYELSTLPIGEANVSFSKMGFQNVRKTVKSDGGETRLDVQLPTGRVLTGRVVGDDGAGIAEAEVMAGSEGVDSGFAGAMSDASGRFRLEGLGNGIFTVRATRRGYVDAELPGVDISKTPDVTVTMSAGATISGHISGIDPSRFKDVTVRVFSTGRGGRITRVAADSAGNYRLEGAPIGKVSVSAHTRGETMQTSESVDLETQSGGNFQADLEFKEHNTVRGRVSRRGVPLRSGSISFSTIAPPIGSATGSIDADGNYEARGVRSGEQRITVMDYNDMTQYVTSRTVTRSQALDIDMNPAAVSGRVISDATEQPIVDASIALEPVDTDAPRWLRPQGHSGNDGRMLIENIPPGRYHVRITKEGFSNYVGEQTLSEGATATIEARLSPAAGITLRILDSRNGQPVRAWVGARSSDGKVLYGEFPSARPDGTVSIPLAPGSYRLNVIAWGLGPAYTNVTSPGAQDVTLRPGGSLEVTVSDPSIRIRVRTPDGADYNFVPGDDGRPMPVLSGFRLPDLAPGSYLMQTFDANGSAGRSVPFEIREGETTKLAL